MKLTPKMTAVLNELKGAAPYYQSLNGDYDFTEVHSLSGVSKPQDSAFQLTDGLHGIFESSATIKALEKRGLLRIHRLGGSGMDIVELLDYTPRTPARKLVELEVVCEYEEPEMSTAFTVWAEPDAVEVAQTRTVARMAAIDSRMKVYIQEGAEVLVTVWSPLA